MFHGALNLPLQWVKIKRVDVRNHWKYQLFQNLKSKQFSVKFCLSRSQYNINKFDDDLSGNEVVGR